MQFLRSSFFLPQRR